MSINCKYDNIAVLSYLQKVGDFVIPGERITIKNLDNLVEQHMAFIIRTASNMTGRYISIENDEEFSIALLAFAEAVEKYEEDRGNFMGFAKIVMESRLKNHFAKLSNQPKTISLEELGDKSEELFIEEEIEVSDNSQLQQEITCYRKELLYFGITLECLADQCPKHKDTRKNAVRIAEQTSRDIPTVELTYRKKKLPIREVAKLTKVTEKVVKKSKKFILATMIIFVKNFPGLTYWIKGARCNHVS